MSIRVNTGEGRTLRRNEAGFTLVELMFASGVLAVTLVLLFGSFLSVSNLAFVAQDRVNAATALTSVMEELRTKDLNGLLGYVPPVLTGKPLRTVSVQCLQSDGTKLTLPTDPKSLLSALPNPVRVLCTVNWTDKKGRTQSVQSTAWYYR